MQRQDLVVVVEPVPRRRVGQLRFLPIGSDGEVIVFLERLDIDLGERRQFLARELPFHLVFRPLRGEGGKHVVEGP